MSEVKEVHPRRKAALREFLARCKQNNITEYRSGSSDEIEFIGTMAAFAKILGFSGAFSLKFNIDDGFIVKRENSVGVRLDKFIDVLGIQTVNGILDGTIQIDIRDNSRKKKGLLAEPAKSKTSSKGVTIDSVTSNLEDAIWALKFVEKVGVEDIFLKQPAVGVLFTRIYKITRECLEVGQPQYSFPKTKSILNQDRVFDTKASIECAKAALTLAKAAQTDRNIQVILDRNPDVFIFVTEIIFGISNIK